MLFFSDCIQLVKPIIY